MKRSSAPLICGLLFAAVGLGATPNDPQEVKQVLTTLDQATQAIVKKDLATIRKTFHEDLTYGHATGRLQTKTELLEDVANPQRVWESWKLTHPTVTIHGSTAIVRCISDVVNGAPGKADLSHTRYLWVLLKGPQGWQIIAGQRVNVPKDVVS